MISVRLKWLRTHHIMVAALSLLAPGILHAGNVSYSIVDENIFEEFLFLIESACPSHP